MRFFSVRAMGWAFFYAGFAGITVTFVEQPWARWFPITLFAFGYACAILLEWAEKRR